MSGRMHVKHSRARDRVSPRRRRRPSIERSRTEQFHHRDSKTADRFKRGRWESPSPPRNRMYSPGRMRRRDFESPPRWGRNDTMSSPRGRRSGFDDRRMSARDLEEDHHLRPMNERAHRDARPPAGLVFLCTSSTLRECFRFRVFGLPAAQRAVVERVVPGTKLFLFNIDTKELFGVFEATSRGGLNLVPEAFVEFKGTYAAQVRFSIIEDPLPLPNNIVSDVLRENFGQKGKFDCELSADKVLKILQLFSQQKMRPGVLSPERGRIAQESRSTALGIDNVNPEGRRNPLPTLDPQILMSRPIWNGGPPPDPAVLLGGAMIEEADQLALKYLQNKPAISGVGLESVNANLFSNSVRNNGQPSFSGPQLDHNQGGLTAASLQPNGMPAPAGSKSRLFGLSGSSVLDSERIEHPNAGGGKIFGQLMPERGLLPLPPVQHPISGILPGNHPGFPPGLPSQLGMIHPFTSTGSFPIYAGSVGAIPLGFGGLHGPFYPLQGAPGMPVQLISGIPTPHLGNPFQVGGAYQGGNQISNHQAPNSRVGSKLKKRQNQRSIYQKVLGGGDQADKSDNRADKNDGVADETPESTET